MYIFLLYIQQIFQHIQDLFRLWAPDVVKCDLIFYRAVGRSNNGILFSGSNPPLLRGDPRLRTIPFPTKRATFNEVKRVHSLLSTVFIYGNLILVLVGLLLNLVNPVVPGHKYVL